MIAIRRFSLANAVAVCALGLAAAACAPQSSHWSEVEAPRENRVSLVRLSHSVQFRANEDRLNPTEIARLAAFIRDQGVGYADEILLLGGDGALGQRRQDAVAMVFARGGLKTVRDVQIEGVPTAPGEVRILVGRHVVTPPACPNWSKRADDDFGNTGQSNLGCATTTNLGLMVANPSDLLAGRTLSPADGELSAFRVESYRHGLYPPLLEGDLDPNSRGDIVKGTGK